MTSIKPFSSYIYFLNLIQGFLRIFKPYFLTYPSTNITTSQLTFVEISHGKISHEKISISQGIHEAL
jgi:hypothetical protein